MQLIYMYQFNIQTHEFKKTECQLVGTHKINDFSYIMSLIKNGKPHRVIRRIKEPGQADVERSSYFVIGYYYEPNKIEDFKKNCIKCLLEYKDKIQNNINSLLGINNLFDESINKLKSSDF